MPVPSCEEARLGLPARATMAQLLAADPGKYTAMCSGHSSFYLSLSLEQFTRIRRYRESIEQGEPVFSHCSIPDEQM